MRREQEPKQRRPPIIFINKFILEVPFCISGENYYRSFILNNNPVALRGPSNEITRVVSSFSRFFLGKRSANEPEKYFHNYIARV